MTDRQNFTRTVRVEVIKRACSLREDGQPNCEECGAVGCKLEVHHNDMDAMKTSEAKKRKLTAKDGKLLCEPCHDLITKAQRKQLAKVEAVESRHLGADRAKHPMKKAPKEPKAPLVTAPGRTGIWRLVRDLLRE